MPMMSKWAQVPTYGLIKCLQFNVSLKEQIASIPKQKYRFVDGLAGGETGLGAITYCIRSFSKQEEDLITTKAILTQENETQSHRLSSMPWSQNEIKRLTDRLDDIDVWLNLQIGIWRLVEGIVLHLKIQKLIIYYHTPKWIVRFESGKYHSFIWYSSVDWDKNWICIIRGGHHDKFWHHKKTMANRLCLLGPKLEHGNGGRRAWIRRY